MDIQDCMTAEEIRMVALEDKHLVILSELILHSWPLTKLRYRRKCHHTGIYRHHKQNYHERQKNNNIGITARQSIKQPQLNHMDIEKTRLIVFESMYWVNINANIEETIKNCPTCLDFQTL